MLLIRGGGQSRMASDQRGPVEENWAPGRTHRGRAKKQSGEGRDMLGESEAWSRNRGSQGQAGGVDGEMRAAHPGRCSELSFQTSRKLSRLQLLSPQAQ